MKSNRLILALCTLVCAFFAPGCVPKYTFNGSAINYEIYKTVDIGNFPIHMDAPDRIQSFEAFFQTDRDRCLAGNRHVLISHCSAISFDHLQGLFKRHFIRPGQRDIRIGKVHILHIFEISHPVFRYPAIAQNRT